MRTNPRPIENGREQRWRWWLMRVDEEKCVYRFVEDYERYDFACLMADAAVVVCGGHFIVFDSIERKPAPYDSRKLAQKSTAADP